MKVSKTANKFSPHNKEVTTHVSLLGAINVDLLNMAQNCKKPVPNIGKLKFPGKFCRIFKIELFMKVAAERQLRPVQTAIVQFYPRPVFARQNKVLK